MSRLGRATAVIAAVASLGAIASAVDATVPPQRQCPANDPLCVFVDKVTTGIPAGLNLGITDADVAAAEAGWTGVALDLQHRLGDLLPLRSAQWVGTHNSFNSMSNDPASLSNLDSNQQVSLLNQLRLGIRSLELDVAWFPDASTLGANTPIMCHELEQHIGCTIDRPLVEGLGDISTYLRQHRSTVVLLYIEDHLDEPAGYDAAVTIFDEILGDLVYRPPSATPCPKLPLDLRRSDVLAAGKQVVIMSGCGQGSAWPALVFDDDVRSEDGNPEFAGYPTCTSPSVTRDDYGRSLVRYYEDSTFITAASGNGPRLSPAEVADMSRCGVNLFGLDQVVPGDLRLDAAVWSWAPGEPSTSIAGTCGALGVQGRFRAVPCETKLRRAACVDPSTGMWSVTAAATTFAGAAARCALDHPGSQFDVPRSGAETQHLFDARAAAELAGCPLWLAYQVLDAGWAPLPSR